MSVDFIDSNVFIYLFDESDAAKSSASQQVIQQALARGSGIISFQVVQETLNVLTMKLGASADDARRFFDAVLDPLWAIATTASLYTTALGLRERYLYSFYDSLIIAAAQASGATRLLSEDLRAGQRIGTLEIVNPFA